MCPVGTGSRYRRPEPKTAETAEPESRAPETAETAEPETAETTEPETAEPETPESNDWISTVDLNCDTLNDEVMRRGSTPRNVPNQTCKSEVSVCVVPLLT